jgi:hypothetical protein
VVCVLNGRGSIFFRSAERPFISYPGSSFTTGMPNRRKSIISWLCRAYPRVLYVIGHRCSGMSSEISDVTLSAHSCAWRSMWLVHGNGQS